MEAAFTIATSVAEPIITSELNSGDLDAFFNKRDTMALIVPGYLGDDEAEYISDNVLRDRKLAAYLAEPAFAKVGFAWYEASNDSQREEYLIQADRLAKSASSLCAPFSSPMDRLHLLLDRKWAAGATVQRISGRPMWYGLPRVLRDGAVEPHEDVLLWDSPDADGIRGYRWQAAANVYLKTAEHGGELALWSRSYSQREYEAFRIPGSYGLETSKIGPPTLVLRPEPGSLILFDSTRVHAVYGASGSPRISFSAFIGYYGPDRPLTLWS